MRRDAKRQRAIHRAPQSGLVNGPEDVYDGSGEVAYRIVTINRWESVPELGEATVNGVVVRDTDIIVLDDLDRPE